jgi:hypothetical protein
VAYYQESPAPTCSKQLPPSKANKLLMLDPVSYGKLPVSVHQEQYKRMSETMCTVVFTLIWLVYNQLMKVNKLIKSGGSRMERVIFHTLATCMCMNICRPFQQAAASHVDGNATAGAGCVIAY